MTNTSSTSHTPPPVRARTTTSPVPIPQNRGESVELRELLETNLLALQALLEEQQRILELRLRAVDGMRAELQAELRALTDARAPWVQALTETRALLYVALREVIVGNNEAGVSLHIPQQEPQDATEPVSPVDPEPVSG
jgi:hypothetical protein